MSGAIRFFMPCIFVGFLFGFPVLASGGCSDSQYIIGDVHSNQNVTASTQGGCHNFYIAGDVSAIGTVTLNNVQLSPGYYAYPGASSVYIPNVDFAAFQAANGQTIAAPLAWGGGTSQIIYVDGDVNIDMLTDIGTYTGKTVVATGNITVTRAKGGHQVAELYAHLIAQGSVFIDLKGCGSNIHGITGLIYGKNGVYIDLRGGGHAEKSINGMVMAKIGDITVDIHGAGNSDKGIEYNEDVINDDLLKFFQILVCWRQVHP